MKSINEIFNSLDTLHERPIGVIKKVEYLLNIGIVILAFLIFILGGELIMSLIILVPLNRAFKELFRGELSFLQRWMRIFVKLMFYLIIMLIIIYILEFTVPSIKSILYFSM